MKKVIVLLLLIVNNFYTHGQIQPTMVMPASMNIGGLPSTLCLDYFAHSPGIEDVLYRVNGDGASQEFLGTGDYAHAIGQQLKNKQPELFLNDPSQKIDAYFLEFVKREISIYQNASLKSGVKFTDAKLEELQYKVWIFKFLDEAGYINRGAIDIVTEYNKKYKLFCKANNINNRLDAFYATHRIARQIRELPEKYIATHELLYGYHHIEVYYTDPGKTGTVLPPEIVNMIGVNIEKFNSKHHHIPNSLECGDDNQFTLQFDDPYDKLPPIIEKIPIQNNNGWNPGWLIQLIEAQHYS